MTAAQIHDLFFKKREMNPEEDGEYFKIDVSLIHKETSDIFDTTRIEFFYKEQSHLEKDFEEFTKSIEVQDSFYLEFVKTYSYSKGKLTELTIL